MAQSIFISYRRLDSQHATYAIADRLRWAFGADEVFFDRGSIRAGNEWPESLRRGLEKAKVLIVVIGNAWLTTADEWGRRRIDGQSDWVRQEICTGLSAHRDGKTSIIPVLLGDAKRLRAEAVDPPLRALAAIEPTRLDDDNWESGLESLIAAIAVFTGMRRALPGDRNPNGSPARPLKKERQRLALSDAEVRAHLEPLARWQLQWGAHPWGVGGQAQEITKSYDFESFADAIDFMAKVSRQIDAWKPPHHPRWENQWKVVNVWFSTWDIDCRVTKLDIEAAKELDSLYLHWKTLPRS
jgi:pterin-4a-carbinolamine dehydratase